MRYYSIPDLHGRYDLLRDAVNAIEKDSMNEAETQYILTGDYIDRGPESREIIEYLMKQKNWICLKGNHEDILSQAYANPSLMDWWFGNGGTSTVRSYGWKTNPYNLNDLTGVIPRNHIDWINNLPLYYETEKQVFVHAGIPHSDMSLPPKTERLKEEMIWMLYSKGEAGGWKGKHVVHGHHQFEDGPHTFHGKNGGRTDLDTFAWYTGRLAIGVFDDTQGPPIKCLEVRGEPGYTVGPSTLET